MSPVHRRTRTVATAPPTQNRTNCDEIYGTAYRSDDERRWFSENCSAWSAAVGTVPDPVAPLPQARQPSAPPPEGRDCNQIRGTPYRNNAERDWYLANCLGNNAQQASAGPDRTDCNEIRGTLYRSNAERQWYIANCGGAQPQVAAPQPGPDRTNCNEIRGTAYRSDNERRWYQANCAGR